MVVVIERGRSLFRNARLVIAAQTHGRKFNKESSMVGSTWLPKPFPFFPLLPKQNSFTLRRVAFLLRSWLLPDRTVFSTVNVRGAPSRLPSRLPSSLIHHRLLRSKRCLSNCTLNDLIFQKTAQHIRYRSVQLPIIRYLFGIVYIFTCRIATQLKFRNRHMFNYEWLAITRLVLELNECRITQRKS